MRNLIASCIVLLVAFGVFKLPSNTASARHEIASTLIADYGDSVVESTVDDWTLKPGQTLVAAQSGFVDDQPLSRETVSDEVKAAAKNVADEIRNTIDDKLSSVESRFTSSSVDHESRITELEDIVSKLQSDVTDLSNGQADLTKRVEELTVKVLTLTKEGKVAAKQVPVNESGDGEFDLAPGEKLLSVDGVPVKSSTFSGGSNGSAVVSSTSYSTSSYGSVPVSSGYGSNGGGTANASQPVYSTQTNYSTSSYSATAVPTSSGQRVSLRRTTPLLNSGRPLRSLFNRQPSEASSAGVCVGPNCN